MNGKLTVYKKNVHIVHDSQRVNLSKTFVTGRTLSPYKPVRHDQQVVAVIGLLLFGFDAAVPITGNGDACATTGCVFVRRPVLPLRAS